MIFRKYKPLDYWTKRGKTYKQKFVYNEFFNQQEKSLLDYLQKISFKTILEFGCGFGRITKLILDNFSVHKFTAFDLSTDQIDNAKELCKNHSNVVFTVSTIQDFNSDEKYDLVIGIETLMHVLPIEINHVINRLANFSQKYMVNLDFFEDPPRTKLANHNFLHNYAKIYQNTGKLSKIDIAPANDKQSIFHAQI